MVVVARIALRLRAGVRRPSRLDAVVERLRHALVKSRGSAGLVVVVERLRHAFVRGQASGRGLFSFVRERSRLKERSTAPRTFSSRASSPGVNSEPPKRTSL